MILDIHIETNDKSGNEANNRASFLNLALLHANDVSSTSTGTVRNKGGSLKWTKKKSPKKK